MKINVIACALVNASPYKNTPISNIIVGAIYCKNPMTDKGIVTTAKPNNNKGIAVATPLNVSKVTSAGETPENPKFPPYVNNK